MLGMHYWRDFPMYVHLTCEDHNLYINNHLFFLCSSLQSILKESYSTTEVVFVAEVMKVFASAFLMFSDKADTGKVHMLLYWFPSIFFVLIHTLFLSAGHVDAVGSGTSKMLWLLLNSTKIILLVVSYAVANILAYYALARVDAAVYTVLLQVSQLQILYGLTSTYLILLLSSILHFLS
jgi:hypothetical protein